MKQRCIEKQSPPEMELGNVVSEGKFFRNLKKEHIAKRYAGDDDDNPVYGFKLHKRHWKYADQQQGPLSVNLRSCIHSASCSIALHPDPDEKNYFHVATIDLGAFNESEIFRSSPLVAQYQPIDDIPNRCHFEIVPRDGTILQWMMIGAALDEPFPPANKLPASVEDIKMATEQHTKYRSFFDIRRWVRNKDGTLTP